MSKNSLDIPRSGVSCDNSGTHVTLIDVSGLNLIGTVPNNWGTTNYPSLAGLILTANPGITGNLPTSIGDQTALTNLVVNGCRFSGAIPNVFSNLNALTYILFTDNRFTGEVPSSLISRTSIVAFRFERNLMTITSASLIGLSAASVITQLYFGGQSVASFPNFPATLNGMDELDISSAGMSGSIPDIFAKFPNLRKLALNDNAALSGSLPASFWTLSLDKLCVAM